MGEARRRPGRCRPARARRDRGGQAGDRGHRGGHEPGEARGRRRAAGARARSDAGGRRAARARPGRRAWRRGRVLARRLLDGGQPGHRPRARSSGSPPPSTCTRTRRAARRSWRASTRARRREARVPAMLVGAVCVPKPGEDGVRRRLGGRRAAAGADRVVVDGLGHGPGAADAARLAAAPSSRARTGAPAGRSEAIARRAARHARRGGRGRRDRPRARACPLLRASATSRASSRRGEPGTWSPLNGTARAQRAPHPGVLLSLARRALLVMHSDGLGTAGRSTRYPGLRRHHRADRRRPVPRLSRGRDDVTVVAVRRSHREPIMSLPLVSLFVRHEQDVVRRASAPARSRPASASTRQDQARIATAVSEIARNAFNYAGGGKIEFAVEGRTRPSSWSCGSATAGPASRTSSRSSPAATARRPAWASASSAPAASWTTSRSRAGPARGRRSPSASCFRARAPELGEAGLAASPTLSRTRAAGPARGGPAAEPGAAPHARRAAPAPGRALPPQPELEDTNRGVVALYAELDEKADTCAAPTR